MRAILLLCFSVFLFGLTPQLQASDKIGISTNPPSWLGGTVNLTVDYPLSDWLRLGGRYVNYAKDETYNMDAEATSLYLRMNTTPSKGMFTKLSEFYLGLGAIQGKYQYQDFPDLGDAFFEESFTKPLVTAGYRASSDQFFVELDFRGIVGGSLFANVMLGVGGGLTFGYYL